MDTEFIKKETLEILKKYSESSGKSFIIPSKYGSGNGKIFSYWIFIQEGEKIHNIGFVLYADENKIHDGLEEMDAKYALKDFESQVIYYFKPQDRQTKGK